MLGESAASCTLGVVHDPAAEAVTLASLDSEGRLLVVETVPLSSMDPGQLRLFWGEEVPETSRNDQELRVLEQAIRRLCPDHFPIPVLLAAPVVQPDPAFAPGEHPALAVFEPGSPLLKVLFALVTSGRVGFVATVLNCDDPGSRIAVRRAPEAELAESLRPQWPLFLEHDVLTACTALLTDAPVSPARAAAMAALIAAWPSAYSYWSSFGRMFSSMDVISVLRNGQSRTYLGTGSEFIGVRWNPRRNAEIVDDVALEHALAMQKHAFLREADALKMALVSVAKALGITVTCTSKRADATKSRYVEVWPPREPFAWAMDMIRTQP
jgi:hypothetical protein